MSEKKIILQCKDVTKSFSDENTALKGVDLIVREGDFLSILGESGSGKSTLLSILGGMDVATTGSVLFEDIDLSRLKEKELAKLRRTKVGFVFQFFNLAPYLTVKENILLPIILDGISVKKYENEMSELLDYLRISDYANKMPSQLSGGEQQRVAIARALLYRPSVILLDEPTGNLDVKNSDEIMALLVKINRERQTTIIQVTHSETNALYGNRIIRISDGKIIEERDVEHADEEIERSEPVEEATNEGNVFPDETENSQTVKEK